MYSNLYSGNGKGRDRRDFGSGKVKPQFALSHLVQAVTAF